MCIRDRVDTLNGSEFTVFAPVDDAFGKIDAATIDMLKNDSALLTKILTYHVVPGQIEPADIDGTHETVEGQDLKVTGSGDSLMVNDAKVICGGVQTANATVYPVSYTHLDVYKRQVGSCTEGSALRRSSRIMRSVVA